MTEKLLEWTGDRWIISLSKNIGAKSIYEKNLDSKTDQIEEFKKTKLTKDLTDAFPDIKLIDIKIEELNDKFFRYAFKSKSYAGKNERSSKSN